MPTWLKWYHFGLTLGCVLGYLVCAADWSFAVLSLTVVVGNVCGWLIQRRFPAD